MSETISLAELRRQLEDAIVSAHQQIAYLRGMSNVMDTALLAVLPKFTHLGILPTAAIPVIHGQLQELLASSQREDEKANIRLHIGTLEKAAGPLLGAQPTPPVG